VTCDHPGGVNGETTYDGAADAAEGDMGRARFRDPLTEVALDVVE
jgi:hypothetical protein